jgi:transformation/transcription domain-associated protein
VACKFYPWLRDILNERILKSAAVSSEPSSLPNSANSSAINSPTNPIKAKQPKQPVSAKSMELNKPPIHNPVSSPMGSLSPVNVKGQQALNPMINHEAARMRLLFAHTPTHIASSHRLSSPGSYTLKILLDLAKESSKFMDSFVPSLIRLAQRLTKEHLQHVVSNAKPLSSLEGSIGGTDVGVSAGARSQDRVMATPSLAIANEFLQLKHGRSNLTTNNIVRPMKVKNDSEFKGGNVSAKKKMLANSPKDTKQQFLMKTLQAPSSSSGAGPLPLNRNTNTTKKRAVVSSSNSTIIPGHVTIRKAFMDMLISCFKLLSYCTFESNEHARMFLQLLSHCLEHSCHIPLLLEITKIVSKIVAEESSHAAMCATAFTMKDKVTLLGKMATFDRLNEISAQPLLSEYSKLVLTICATSETNPLYPSISGSFMIGLLSSDSNLRSKFFEHFENNSGNSPSAKLKYILEQDWQSCGTRFWPVIATELLLKSLKRDHVPTVSNGGILPLVATSSAVIQTFLEERSWWSEHLNILREWQSQVKSSSIIDPLCQIIHIDLDMATRLWSNLFAQVWSQLNPVELIGPTQSLMRLLSVRYHRRELRMPMTNSSRHNVVQTLMEGIIQAYPMPIFTAELLLYLANTYNVWGQVIRICEYQALNPMTLIEDRERWVDVLESIYLELNEIDWQVGLNMQACQKPETRMALYLQAQGYVHEAQDMYFQALSQTAKALKIEANAFELKVLECQWVSCVSHLCQWSLMNDFAKATQNQELLLECCWKRGDWATSKQLLHASSIQAASEAGCPLLRLKKLYIAILDGDKKPQIDSLTSQLVDLALHQWQGLPRMLTRAHVPLLHLFHQFVEVKESIQMMSEIKSASQQHTLPNLKPYINTWRERLPNKDEPILMWDDILTWRSHMFSVVKSTFSWSDAQLLACMHDSPWSIIKMAHTARKQHLPDVCLQALSHLYSIPAMDVQDAFSKLREQVSICYETTKELKGGLSLLNNTNLDYFDAHQKAELFRLKGLFLESLGEKSDANHAFSHSLQLCDSYGKGWLSWGQYCDTLFQERKDIEFAAQTIACYLQAVHHRSTSARLYLARVLWLLSMDNEKGILIQAFETHGKQLPIWIWILWIPQLLMSVCRPEAPQVCDNIFSSFSISF